VCKHLPRLRDIHFLDFTLFKTAGPDLPLNLPPRLDADDLVGCNAHVTLLRPGLAIYVAKDLVHRLDMKHMRTQYDMDHQMWGGMGIERSDEEEEGEDGERSEGEDETDEDSGEEDEEDDEESGSSEEETRSEAVGSEVEEDMGVLEGIFNTLHARSGI